MNKILYTSKIGGVTTVKDCIPELEKLAKARGENRVKFIAEAKSCIIKAVSELAKNCLVGNIPLEKFVLDKLKKYQNVLKILCKKTTSIEAKRKLLVRDRGFLRILIPPTITFLSKMDEIPDSKTLKDKMAKKQVKLVNFVNSNEELDEDFVKLNEIMLKILKSNPNTSQTIKNFRRIIKDLDKSDDKTNKKLVALSRKKITPPSQKNKITNYFKKKAK